MFLVAQPTIQWQKNFGGTDSDEAKSIQQTSDGGFVVVGNTYSLDNDVASNHGLCDSWIVKNQFRNSKPMSLRKSMRS